MREVGAEVAGTAGAAAEDDDGVDADGASQALGMSGPAGGPSGPGNAPEERFRRIRMVGCDFRRSADSVSLDPANPSGEASLDLSQPYHRTVAERLLRVALHNDECEFLSVKFDWVTEAEEASSEGRRFELPFAGLLVVRVRAGWVDPATVRRRADEARRRQARERLESRQAELQRLHRLLHAKGDPGDAAAATEAALKRAETALEADGASYVDTLIHVMSSEAVLGRSGGAGGRAGGGGGAMPRGDDQLAILRMSVPDLYLSCEEAVRLLSTAPVRSADVSDRVTLVARLLQRLVDPANAPTLLRAVLPDDERTRVMAKMGLARFRLSIGFSTGRYALDLSLSEDRALLHRLAAVSREHRRWMDTRFPGLDTSQWGDFERFRNATLGGQPFRMTEGWARGPPSAGIAEFDFVDAIRPPLQARSIHSLRLAQVLRDCGMEELCLALRDAERAVARELLRAAARRAAASEAGGGSASPRPGSGSDRGADERGRSAKADEGPNPSHLDLSVLDVARMSFRGPPEMCSALASHANDLPLPPFDGRQDRAPRSSDVTGLHGAGDEPAGKMPEMRFRDFPELFQPVRVTASPVNSPALQLRAGAFLLRLLGALAHSYLSARQLADIVRALPLSVPGLRVEVAVSLFPRVLDLAEFDRVLFALSGPERKRVVRRLGWLNLWNPMRPDGDYVLDLRVWEERMMATLLAQLAVVEPGETVMGVGGRGGPDFNRIAGWRLPTTWIDETPDHGVLRLHFSSYERGCRPDMALRKALCRHVLTFC
ncbi:hypothetical protein FNF28_04792 [Cafeteria roenbergensis]|uniref:Uncharacterized protein n=1 Tax=Cafeteria roenbergensis TaxID=33653 RepID=A0A5A8DAH5_CAFRO|nr:hypothetical protein FNF28_04792 [Cafeteria roenbergensis]